MTDKKELTIISEVLGGHHEHYRFLVERYNRGLVQHLYNFMQDEQSAEDVAQEAFVQAYLKLSQYNDDYAFSTWLYKIADNLAYRYLKKTKSVLDIDEYEELISDDKPSLPDVTDKLLTQAAVLKAVQALPIAYQQVINLYYWDDFSYEEIAEIMERPVGTIRTWLYRAKEELRKELYGQV